ncbi:MAG: DNA primase [Pseudomonadota bacterium]
MPRFTPDFLDEIRARLRASDIIGRHVKLKKEGREFRGLSPFTSEKTPSFFVNDEKGRFFDFSSGKSGDIVGFLMEVQKLSFPEAVTTLAELAGVPLPQDTPEDRHREEKAKGLAEACLDAAKFFRAMLSRTEGREGAAYFDRRSVSDGARKAFGLGYAPDSRTALKDYLLNKDYSPDLLVEAGLLIQPEDGSTPYDRFRGRVMFPIMGQRDRVIAFGGRALSKNAKAKYLNSPETPLFHKSATLYNLGAARKLASQTKRPIIVAEGYMDVIAIAEAGWPAVAPLGTALTEQQLNLLWRSQDTPILCFDGDRAGKAAAHRAIDRALPLLKPGKSLKFAFLPEGLDPDDLIKQQGVRAFEALLEDTSPLADVLWAREQDTQARSTPEEQAQFRRHLRELVKSIADPDVRHAYGEFIAGKMGGRQPGAANIFMDDNPQGQRTEAKKREWTPYRKGGGPRGAPAPQASAALKAAVTASPRHAPAPPSREALLVIGLAHHPALFNAHEDAVLELKLADKGLGTLLTCIVDALLANPDLDSEALTTHILASQAVSSTYKKWRSHTLIRSAKLAKSDTLFAVVQAEWLNALAIDKHEGELEMEVLDAAADSFRDEGQERIWRTAIAHRSRLVAESKSGTDPSDE